MGASSVETKNPNQSRLNGWSCPPHPFQFVAWTVIIYLAAFFYCTAIPSMVQALQYANYTVSFRDYFIIFFYLYVCFVYRFKSVFNVVTIET